jgi:hypothetical protein
VSFVEIGFMDLYSIFRECMETTESTEGKGIYLFVTLCVLREIGFTDLYLVHREYMETTENTEVTE